MNEIKEKGNLSLATTDLSFIVGGVVVICKNVYIVGETHCKDV